LGGLNLKGGTAGAAAAGNPGRAQIAAERTTAALLNLLERFCCLAKNLFGVHSGVRLSKYGHVFDPCRCHLAFICVLLLCLSERKYISNPFKRGQLNLH
jgi:hypothetical protein